MQNETPAEDSDCINATADAIAKFSEDHGLTKVSRAYLKRKFLTIENGEIRDARPEEFIPGIITKNQGNN